MWIAGPTPQVWLSKSGVGPGNLHLYQSPSNGDADGAPGQHTLRISGW